MATATTATTTTVDITRALATPDLRWPFTEELRWLAERAAEHSLIVEVGSYLGRSTIAMAANTSGHVYAIDDWYGPRDDDSVREEDRPELYARFLRNVEGLCVTALRCDHGDTAGLPAEWLRGPEASRPDMVFIDGGHEYGDVKRDILIWKARLRSGGLLCGHDRCEPGVRQALDELLPGWRAVPGDTILWYWTEDAAMATGLRKMTVDDLKLTGTANPLPSPMPPTHPPAPMPATGLLTEWKQLGGEAPLSKIGLAVMIPSITRNSDGSLRYIPPEWGVGLALQAPLANCRHAILTIKDMQRDLARTALVKQARSYGARYAYFQDDDVVPPPDVLQKLQYVLENADDDVAVAAGIYTTKTDPCVPLVFQDQGIGPFWKWRKGEIFECRAIATGCMMIRMSVFDTLPEPWFVDVHGVEHARSLGLYDTGGALPLSAEWTDDMFFCHQLRKAGWRLMAHGGVLCDHWGQDGRCYTLAADSYPMRGGNKDAR